MHAKDRIVTDSNQHWALYTLAKYEELTNDHGVTPETLYSATGEKLPSPDFLREAFSELVYRRLVEKDEQDNQTYYQTQYPAGVALKHHGTPERSPWTNPVTFSGVATVNVDDEWVPGPSDNIYYESEVDRYERGERKVAKAVAEKFPQWTVVITMGPYRSHDVQYMISDDEQPIIQLDFYSPNPGVQYTEALLWSLSQAIKQKEVRERFSGESGPSTPTWSKVPNVA